MHSPQDVLCARLGSKAEKPLRRHTRAAQHTPAWWKVAAATSSTATLTTRARPKAAAMSKKLYRHSWDRLVEARAFAWPHTNALQGKQEVRSIEGVPCLHQALVHWVNRQHML